MPTPIVGLCSFCNCFAEMPEMATVVELFSECKVTNGCEHKHTNL